MTKRSPFRYFKTSPEIIRLAVMLYVRFPLSLRNVEDLLNERSIDVSHESIRFWWNRFGPPHVIVNDLLRSYGEAVTGTSVVAGKDLKDIGKEITDSLFGEGVGRPTEELLDELKEDGEYHGS